MLRRGSLGAGAADAALIENGETEVWAVKAADVSLALGDGVLNDFFRVVEVSGLEYLAQSNTLLGIPSQMISMYLDISVPSFSCGRLRQETANACRICPSSNRKIGIVFYNMLKVAVNAYVERIQALCFIYLHTAFKAAAEDGTRAAGNNLRTFVSTVSAILVVVFLGMIAMCTGKVEDLATVEIRASEELVVVILFQYVVLAHVSLKIVSAGAWLVNALLLTVSA